MTELFPWALQEYVLYYEAWILWTAYVCSCIYCIIFFLFTVLYTKILLLQEALLREKFVK
jgi:hypothetical protein